MYNETITKQKTEVKSMSKKENEVMTQGILKDLVEMSEENFQKCVEYADNMDKTARIKEFLDVLISTAIIERKKTIQTA